MAGWWKWLTGNKEHDVPNEPPIIHTHRTQPEIADVKYVFVDVVGFTRDRDVTSQAFIVRALNRIVDDALRREYAYTAAHYDAGEVIRIPTGDGIAVAMLNFFLEELYDAHLRISWRIIEGVYQITHGERRSMKDFEVRVGVNECKDLVVEDINNRRNVVGRGISQAERIMSKADGNQILVGSTVYENVYQQEKYFHSFKRFDAVDKHNLPFTVYQFLGSEGMPAMGIGLNTNTPTAFRN